jgi:hypothetical protein
MKRIYYFVCASAICCAGAYGQTNCSGPSLGLLALPPVRLRALPDDPKKAAVVRSVSEPAIAAAPSTGAPPQPTEKMTLSTATDYLDPELYRRLEQEGCFTRWSSADENAVTKCVDAVFRPEVVHIGKTALSCSIITAIKRKNPLCLLNPMVLNLSW